MIILIAAGIGFFLVSPKYLDLQELRFKIAEKNVEIETRQDYFAELSQAALEFNQYEANLEKVETALPVNVDAPAVMNFVQSAAMQSGLIVKTISFAGFSNKVLAKEKKESAGSKAGTSYVMKTYNIEAEFTGDYFGLKDFLSRVESSSRLIGVDSIGITLENVVLKDSQTAEEGDGKEKKESDNPMLNFSIKLSANYY